MRNPVVIAIACAGMDCHAAALGTLVSTLSPQSELWLLGELPADTMSQLPVGTVRQVVCDLTQSPDAADVLAALQPLLDECQPKLLLFDGSHLGCEVATRLATRLNGTSLCGVTTLSPDGEGWLVQRPLYSCNLMGEYRCTQGLLCLSMANDSLPEAVPCATLPQVISVQSSVTTQPTNGYRLLSLQQPQENGNRLEKAERVLAIGRGCKDTATRQKIQNLARCMGAELGATRPAALDGYLGLSEMLGISGVSTAPALCIAFGASGATPFVMGVRKSRLIVAVNNDPNALIFGICDIGIVDSCEAVVAELLHYFEEVAQ